MLTGEAKSAEEADQQDSERSATTLLTGTGPTWELHGPRVARRLRNRTRFACWPEKSTVYTPST